MKHEGIWTLEDEILERASNTAQSAILNPRLAPSTKDFIVDKQIELINRITEDRLIKKEIKK